MPSTITASLNSLLLDVTRPYEDDGVTPRDDLIGMKVWVSVTNGFNPLDGSGVPILSPVFDGPGLNCAINDLTPGTTYYVRYALISEIDPSVIVLSPQLSGVPSSAGSGGTNSALIFIYKRSASAPSLPSVDSTYTFATATLTGQDNGWVTAIPAGTDPLYVSTTTAVSSGSTDTIVPSDWAPAVIMVRDGTQTFIDSNGAIQGVTSGAGTLVSNVQAANQLGGNWLKYSCDLSKTNWVKTNCTAVYGGVVGMDGVTFDNTTISRSASGNHSIFQQTSMPASNAVVCFSAKLKLGTMTGNITLRIRDGADLNEIAQSVTATNGWARFYIAGTMPSGATGNIKVYIDPDNNTGSAGDSFYVGDTQLEIGIIPTACIYTENFYITNRNDISNEALRQEAISGTSYIDNLTNEMWSLISYTGSYATSSNFLDIVVKDTETYPGTIDPSMKMIIEKEYSYDPLYMAYTLTASCKLTGSNGTSFNETNQSVAFYKMYVVGLDSNGNYINSSGTITTADNAKILLGTYQFPNIFPGFVGFTNIVTASVPFYNNLHSTAKSFKIILEVAGRVNYLSGTNYATVQFDNVVMKGEFITPGIAQIKSGDTILRRGGSANATLSSTQYTPIYSHDLIVGVSGKTAIGSAICDMFIASSAVVGTASTNQYNYIEGDLTTTALALKSTYAAPIYGEKFTWPCVGIFRNPSANNATVNNSAYPSYSDLRISGVYTADAASKWSNGKSFLLSAVGNYLNIEQSSGPIYALPYNDFTIEFYVNFTTYESPKTIVLFSATNASGYGLRLDFNWNADGFQYLKLYVSTNGTSWNIIGGTGTGSSMYNISTGSWMRFRIQGSNLSEGNSTGQIGVFVDNSPMLVSTAATMNAPVCTFGTTGRFQFGTVYARNSPVANIKIDQIKISPNIVDSSLPTGPLICDQFLYNTNKRYWIDPITELEANPKVFVGYNGSIVFNDIFDSGWFRVATNNSYTINHNLGVPPGLYSLSVLYQSAEGGEIYKSDYSQYYSVWDGVSANSSQSRGVIVSDMTDRRVILNISSTIVATNEYINVVAGGTNLAYGYIRVVAKSLLM